MTQPSDKLKRNGSVCSICGKWVSNPQGMKMHQKTHGIDLIYPHKPKTKRNLYINWDERRWGVTLANGMDSQLGGYISTRDIGRNIELSGPISLTSLGKVKLIMDIAYKVWKL